MDLNDDDFITNAELDNARECLERRNCIVQWDVFEKDVIRAMAAHRLGGGNYRADDDTFPTRVWFANGRTVGIAFDGDKPYLTVGRHEQETTHAR